MQIRYPPELPVSERRDEVAAALEAHQVVIVAGATGSGKTTQLPKICLDAGRGTAGMIGHTQPRRLAARTVAARIAEELGVELGEEVGYAVRFTDRVGARTRVKLMTDGILLNEIHRDRTLRAYDTIIVDEAHERSLNIDFLLGYLARLLARRPDLSLIVTSATIDAERFARHFGGAPVIEVTGRTYPVEIRYRPLDDEGATRDQVTGICDAVEELWTEHGRGDGGPGDILVFLSGEREIRDAARALADLRLPETEILPLYARLPTAEQQRVFAPHRGRRVVLATNVAETSLTVPGIRYVVDPGTARVSRYSHRLKVQRLPIEPISRASADQRAGRCGRLAPGICIRLYGDDDFAGRAEYTEPEILRTNLASVILQMAALRLGDVDDFPFLDPPDRRAVTDGIRLLHELGALDERDPDRRGLRLTATGRQMARLPVDPRFARMVVEGHRRRCLREVLVIVAALSIEDPRERPSDRAGAADELHRRFAAPGSDFLAYLSLWRHVRDQQRALSGSAFRRLCRDEHLNFLRIREWQDVHSQLRRVAGQLEMRQSEGEAPDDEVHRALLSGLLSHIGRREGETREYRGARGARFAIFPGSSLARRPPSWVMAAELVETSRLWGRTVARIRPEWAEELAPHLVTRTVTDPEWSEERGAATARETVSLFGLPLVTGRTVQFARVDPAGARALLIRHALVRGEWRSTHAFVAANRAVLDDVARLEHRFRRDLLVEEDALVALYDARIPDEVVSVAHFDRWWSRARREHPDLLTFRVDDVLDQIGDDLDDAEMPETWRVDDLQLDVTYVFDPGAPDDGVTVHVPLAVLNRLSPRPFEWQVPGLRRARIEALLRSLPKAHRRHLGSLPDLAARLAATPAAVTDAGAATAPDDALLPLLARAVAEDGAPAVGPGDWHLGEVPDHLHVRFVVEDDAGRPLGAGRDLAVLADELAPRLRASLAADPLERTGQRTWTFGSVPRTVTRRRGGHDVVGFPALRDEGETVGLTVLDSRAAQADAHWAGIRRLLRLTLPVPSKEVRRRLDRSSDLWGRANPYAGPAALATACTTTALDALMERHGAPVWDDQGFVVLRDAVAGDLVDEVRTVTALATRILATVAVVDRALVAPSRPALTAALDDVAAQRTALVHDGFLEEVGAARLADLLRYARAMAHRLDALGSDPGRDAERMHQVHRVEAAYATLVDHLPHHGPVGAELERIGWGIEELRVSLFAQQLGTSGPVSETRLMASIDRLRRG